MTFEIEGEIISGADIRSVWWRRIVPPNLDHLNPELMEYCTKEQLGFMEGLEYVLPNALWVSKPSSINKGKSKIFQLQIAERLGFQTLKTVFTNSPNMAKEFIQTQRAIYKSICSPRVPVIEDKHSTVFTTIIEEKHFSDMEGLLSCPGILQQFCQKVADIRVTVFGQTVFAVRIESQMGSTSKVDFRCGARHLPHVAHELPSEVASLCVVLTRELGLQFGAIDLALLEDSSYVFFEINPNGQWGWLEEKTGLTMRRSFLNLLMGN